MPENPQSGGARKVSLAFIIIGIAIFFAIAGTVSTTIVNGQNIPSNNVPLNATQSAPPPNVPTYNSTEYKIIHTKEGIKILDGTIWIGFGTGINYVDSQGSSHIIKPKYAFTERLLSSWLNFKSESIITPKYSFATGDLYYSVSFGFSKFPVPYQIDVTYTITTHIWGTTTSGGHFDKTLTTQGTASWSSSDGKEIKTGNMVMLTYIIKGPHIPVSNIATLHIHSELSMKSVVLHISLDGQAYEGGFGVPSMTYSTTVEFARP